MAGFQCGASSIMAAGSTATSVVSSNTRVKTASGYVGTVADVVNFPGTPIIGNWIVPASRCSISSIPVINASSTGMAYSPGPSGLTPAGPMQVNPSDSHASGQ